MQTGVISQKLNKIKPHIHTHTNKQTKKNDIVDLNRQIQNQRKGIEKAGYNNYYCGKMVPN